MGANFRLSHPCICCNLAATGRGMQKLCPSRSLKGPLHPQNIGMILLFLTSSVINLSVMQLPVTNLPPNFSTNWRLTLFSARRTVNRASQGLRGFQSAMLHLFSSALFGGLQGGQRKIKKNPKCQM